MKLVSTFLLAMSLTAMSLMPSARADNAPAIARQLPDFTQLIEQNGTAVVNISTSTKKTDKSAKDDSKGEMPKLPPNIPDDTPFKDFFRHFFNEEGEEGNDYFEERPLTSLGSGFIISTDGYVITNNHVVENAGEIFVKLNDRREFVAKLIGSDKRSDIALLKIEATHLPAVKLGSSESLKVGEWVFAIGSPFGFEYSATAGIVSAKGRSLPRDNYVPFIQTDVAINPGNSGGPLFNMNGEVVGVNSQIYSRTGGFMGLSFAIPVELMNHVVEQLKANGKVSRGWLGVLIQDVTRQLAESFNMEKPQGALVAKVLPNSPAEKSELKVGDIILKYDGKVVDRSSDLPPLVGMTKVGEAAKAQVLRQGKILDVTITIAELPSEEELQTTAKTGGRATANANKLGLAVSDLDKKMREEYEISEQGVFVDKVENGSSAQDAGIRKEDIIVMLDNVTVQNARQFKELVAELKAGRTVPILINRRGNPLFLAIKVGSDK